MFARDGFSQATMRDVADEAGMPKGSLYHYVQTKEDLLFRIFAAVHADVAAIRGEVARMSDVDPLERLRIYVKRQVLYNLANHDRITVYYHDSDQFDGQRAEAVSAGRRDANRFVRAAIKDAQGSGMLDPSLDPRLLSNTVFSTIVWTYRWYKPGGPYSREAIAEHCSRFVLGGSLGQRPGPSPAPARW